MPTKVSVHIDASSYFRKCDDLHLAIHQFARNPPHDDFARGYEQALLDVRDEIFQIPAASPEWSQLLRQTRSMESSAEECS